MHLHEISCLSHESICVSFVFSCHSCIFRYVYPMKKLSMYPAFVDADGLTISMPPATNSEETKVTFF